MARIICLIAVLSMLLSSCISNRSFSDGRDDVTADLALKTALLRDREHNYNDVDLTLFEGRLLLTGTISSQAGRDHVANIASRTKNVSEVLNEIQVGEKTPFRVGAQDAVLDQKVLAALARDRDIITANYGVAVSNGTIYLIGVARGPKELERVTEKVRRIPGTKQVVSHIIFLNDGRRDLPREAS